MKHRTPEYLEVKNKLAETLRNGFEERNMVVDVYDSYYQNIPMFPAVAIETERRTKKKRGTNQLEEIIFKFNVWTYVKIMDYTDAENACLELTEIVEDIIEADKSLGGLVNYLDIDADLDFGVVESTTGVFLQGSKMLLDVKFLRRRPPKEEN